MGWRRAQIFIREERRIFNNGGLINHLIFIVLSRGAEAGQGGKGVHDEVDPEHLDGAQGAVLWET